VIAAAIMHGTLNGTAGIPIMMIRGGSDLIVGITGFAGFVVLLVANLGLWILIRCTDGIVEDGEQANEVRPDNQ
jgi:hypothetical protein